MRFITYSLADANMINCKRAKEKIYLCLFAEKNKRCWHAILLDEMKILKRVMTKVLTAR